MSKEELVALQPGIEPKPGPQSTIVAGMPESQMPRIPEELSILPVRGFVVLDRKSTRLNSSH